MHFSLSKSVEILERTPDVLITMLYNLSNEWTANNEGGESWNVYEIIGHLIHGEKTDWIPRMEVILSDKTDKSFVPFDRFAQLKKSETPTLHELLDEFKSIRQHNTVRLKSKELTEADLEKTGIHPEFGAVTLSQLISTWAVHDLNHIAQIVRVMAKQYKNEVGPWKAYLRILQS
ncbi:DinB family protein [Ferruginibacter paludis]|uniref:DinB family protein n=1 Tax=Ferruginibacter paludis TaxID=1310417 RepID=UPI0025B6064A|nr:DinB family protein [Ferruginibacter paludis]MDN3656041.1 DinB family protein [Ferruginibacter paludis]